MEILFNPVLLLLATAKEVLPVLGLLVIFQTLVLRKPLPQPGRIVFGFGAVLVGMTCFLGGLDLALFPIGRTMALQLAEGAQKGGSVTWAAYGWVYLFAFLMGFSTTIAEPSLIAVAHKAHEASRKANFILGTTYRGCYRGWLRYNIGYFSNRYRDTALSLYNGRICSGYHSNRICAPDDYSIGV